MNNGVTYGDPWDYFPGVSVSQMLAGDGPYAEEAGDGVRLVREFYEENPDLREINVPTSLPL